MEVLITKIKIDVRICLDENKSGSALITSGDIDTLTLDEIIESKIVEAIQRVHLHAPNYLLEGGHNFGDAVYWDTKLTGCCGWVLLPTDFLRLVVFEMSDWEQAVYQAITTDDPDYVKQRSRFKGIRGTAQRPVCALAIRPEGRVLEFYSCKTKTAQVSRAVYLPYPEIDSNGYVDLSQRCYTSIIYTAASLTLATLGASDQATALDNLATALLQ